MATNVPDNLREMWREIYILFDVNYRMENTPEAWGKYWDQVKQMDEKYKDLHLVEICMIIADMISDRMKTADAGRK